MVVVRGVPAVRRLFPGRAARLPLYRIPGLQADPGHGEGWSLIFPLIVIFPRNSSELAFHFGLIPADDQITMSLGRVNYCLTFTSLPLFLIYFF